MENIFKKLPLKSPPEKIRKNVISTLKELNKGKDFPKTKVNHVIIYRYKSN